MWAAPLIEVKVCQVMTDKLRHRPYAEQGARLRERRRLLQKTGRLHTSWDKLSKAAGVTVSGFQQWERGETWPTAKHKPKLAALMGWSELELDHGPQEPESNTGDTLFHPVSPQELEVLALYRALEDQKIEALRWLKARVMARHALQAEVRGDLRAVPDQQVERHIKPPPFKIKQR